jgi:hypothetical protein
MYHLPITFRAMEGVAAGRLGPKTTVAGIVLASLVPTSAFISGVSSNWIR